MDNNIMLKNYQSLNEMKSIIDESNILILDDKYPDTFLVVSCGNEDVFGFVTTSYGCNVNYKRDSVFNISYIGIGKYLIGINNEGHLIFHKKLGSCLVDLIMRQGKDLIAVCELDIYSIVYDKEKWRTGIIDMIYNYELVNEDTYIKLELSDNSSIFVNIEDGVVSFKNKRM